MNTNISEEIARKVLQTVDAGLCPGIGSPIPGQMCVEAAVCYAYGLKHSDDPPCVGEAIRDFKITLNDSDWSSYQARAKGMRKLAIAQLGSNIIDQNAFIAIVVREIIHQIIPIVLRNVANQCPKYSQQLEEVASLCEKKPMYGSVLIARTIVYTGYCDTQVSSRSRRILREIDKMMFTFSTLNTRFGTIFSSELNAELDHILSLFAKIALQALIELKSPGCEYLYLCE